MALAWVVLTGAWGILWRVPVDRVLRRRVVPAYVAVVYRRLIAACGVRLEVTGVRERLTPPGEPALVVANHVSWLDVMALSAVQPVTMISKREIAGWPVIGRLARVTGTIFLDRHRLRDADRVRRVAAQRLRSGSVVATFPEATTTCGRGLARWYPAMFQAAVDAGVPVQPVALTWVDRTGVLTTAGAYVGEQPLLDSIRSIVGQRDLVLRVEILPSIRPTHVRPIGDRRALRDAAAVSVAAAVGTAVGDWHRHVRPVTCQAHHTAGPELGPLPAAPDLRVPRIPVMARQ